MEYPNFKVCVRCFTFNHSKYITDAMNGFVMQQTDFPYVCCIVDDASKDGEQDVIRKYVADNFDLSEGSCHFEREIDYAFITYAQHKTNKNCYFAVLYLKENHYSIKKPKMPYLTEWQDECEYEALCEGDDYWIAHNKLQLQADFLDSHPDYVMCHTSFKYFYQSEHKFLFSKDVMINKPPYPVNNYDILLKYHVQTVTVMMRQAARKNALALDSFLFSGYFKMGDTQLWYQLSKVGKIHFIDSVTSVYRKNFGSATKQNGKQYFRFSLSSAEMRYYIAIQDSLPEDIFTRFKNSYELAVNRYWLFDSEFVPTIGNKMVQNINGKYPWLKKQYYTIQLIIRPYFGFIYRLFRRYW